MYTIFFQASWTCSGYSACDLDTATNDDFVTRDLDHSQGRLHLLNQIFSAAKESRYCTSAHESLWSQESSDIPVETT